MWGITLASTSTWSLWAIYFLGIDKNKYGELLLVSLARLNTPSRAQSHEAWAQAAALFFFLFGDRQSPTAIYLFFLKKSYIGACELWPDSFFFFFVFNVLDSACKLFNPTEPKLGLAWWILSRAGSSPLVSSRLPTLPTETLMETFGISIRSQDRFKK